MATPGAGASLMVANEVNVMIEIAPWLFDISGDDDQDETDAGTFSPGALTPVKNVLKGAVTRTITIQGRWTSATQTFFKAISGFQNRAFEWSPEGRAVGKTKIFGAVNVGAWPLPSQPVDGVMNFSLELSVVSIDSEVIVTAPATVAITSSSVADPTSITTSAPHALTSGDVVTIAGHTGATPSINGSWVATVVDTTHFTIPVAVTVGGTGGTVQD